MVSSQPPPLVTPSGKADPTLALSERAYIKPCVVSVCHVGNLVFHEAGQDQVPAGAHEGREAWRQLAQWPRKDVRQEDVHSPW
jgi:hypothetical protein